MNIGIEHASMRVTLQLSGHEKSSERFKLNNVRTVQNLSLPVQSVSPDELGTKFPHLQGLPLAQYSEALRILIGIDNGKLGLPLKIKEGSWTKPIATKTRLGWTVVLIISNLNLLLTYIIIFMHVIANPMKVFTS